MGFPWKAVLGGLEQVARITSPAAAAIDDSVHAAIDSKTGDAKEAAILAAVQAGFIELQMFKPDMIADTTMFNAGVLEAHEAFDKISKSLKKAK